MDFSSGVMNHNIKDNFYMIICMDLALIYGHLEKNMQENGKKVKKMVKVLLHGAMEKGFQFYFSYVGGFKNDKYFGYGEIKWPDGRYFKVNNFL